MPKYVDPSSVSALVGRLGGPKSLLQVRVRGEGGRFISIYRVNATNVANLRFEANTIQLQNTIDDWIRNLLSGIIGTIQNEIHAIVNQAVYETEVEVSGSQVRKPTKSSYPTEEMKRGYTEFMEAMAEVLGGERKVYIYERTYRLMRDMINSVIQISENQFLIQIPPVSGGEAWNPFGKTYYPILVDKGHRTTGGSSFVVGRPFIMEIRARAEEIVRIAYSEGGKVIGKILNRYFSETFRAIDKKVGKRMLIKF